MKRVLFFALTLLVLGAAAPHSYAATLWVAPDGGSNGNGSQNSPYRSIQHAADRADPGDTVRVLPGLYKEIITTDRDGTASERIHYVSDTKWGAIIAPPDDTDETVLWTNEAQYIDIEGFEFDASTTPTIVKGIFNGGPSDGGSNVRIFRNRVHHIRGSGSTDEDGGGIVTAAGEFLGTDVKIYQNIVHTIGDTNSSNDPMFGILFTHKGGEIHNNIVYRTEGCGIRLANNVRQVSVANNLIFNVNDCGIEVGAGVDPDTSVASGITVTNNIVRDSGEAMREVGATNGNRFNNNILYQNQYNTVTLLTGTKVNVWILDPKMVNYADDGTGNYHLTISSQAIDNGTSLGAPTVDFDNKPRPSGAGHDIGPFEYDGTSGGNNTPPTSEDCNRFMSLDPPFDGFGAAWNPFSGSHELLLTSKCNDNATVTYEAGSNGQYQYIYNVGYYYTSEWKTFTLSGALISGTNVWLGKIGTYTHQNPPSGDYYWVGYVCQWENSAWRCGCRDATCDSNYWQLQGVVR